MAVKTKPIITEVMGGQEPVTSGGQVSTPVPNADPNIEQTLGSTTESSIQNNQTGTNNYEKQTPTVDNNNQLYYDLINANKAPTIDVSKDKSSGSAAAKDTMYSWDKMGADQAQNQYQQDVLKAKQDALANRQTIEQNAVNYQQQADMMKYSQAQNAEKVGWTGGYVLDQNRQMEYLKSSIQAQMYGAMELQKYGYDSALAAARLSYDLNQKEFAHKYYQDAVNVAISEAQITGVYFSPETRDMMSQYSTANQELGDLKDKSIEEIDEGIANGSISLTPEQARAHEVKKNIESWYSANGVTKTGVKTLAAIQYETSMMQDWADKQWEMFQAANDAANNKVASDVNAFILVDKNGNPMYTGTEVQTGNWKTMSGQEIANYLFDENGNVPSQKKEQFFSYIDTQLGGQVTAGFTQYCKANEITDGFEEAMTDYLTSSDAIGKFLSDKFSNISEEQGKVMLESLNGYSVELAMPDGKSFTYRLQAITSDSTEKPKEPSENKGDGKLPITPILTTDYADGKELIKDLTNNKEFEDLANSLSQINWEEDPMNWYDNPDSTGGQWLKLLGGEGSLAAHIQGAIKANDYKEFGNSLKEAKATIITQIGEQNYKLLQKTYNDYLKMSDRDRALLSDKEKEYYSKVASFATGLQNLDKAITYCSNNDSDIITNGWDNVADTWAKVGDQWEDMNNVLDFIIAAASTGEAVITTVIGGVTGLFRWMFGGY